MVRARPAAALLVIVSLAAAAGPVGAADLGRYLDPATAPFIPIPEIDLDPYSGTTLGLIPTVLHTNAQDQIDEIIAPDIIRNQYFGWGSRVRVFGFPSVDEEWMVVGGGKQRVEREFDARFAAGELRQQAWSWSIEAIYDRSGSPRFFGVGNASLLANQSNYLDDQSRLDLAVGRNFSPALQLGYLVRMRYVDVLPGVLPGVPSMTTLFPGELGIGAQHELQQRLTLTYDTRDSPVIPHEGVRYLVYAGVVAHVLASSVAYSYAGAEARGYQPIGRDVTLAWHVALRYMPAAKDAPFWALGSLGGDLSVPGESEPLRSDGSDRYLDRNLSAGGAELRTRVAGFDAFGTRVTLELAPFIDLGKVFADPGESPLTHLHSAAGLGVRAIASPHVVGYVDIGYGQGRGAVFSGINYPF
ncbi:MAG: BamA/TamA family outer membrane protein [Gammaproteobacteria bacterium]|nr:BamA/TamA family outer membrane protein [Gammaproteobacteria bacterium]